jgi:hypothetical protein
MSAIHAKIWGEVLSSDRSMCRPDKANEGILYRYEKPGFEAMPRQP